MMRNGDRVNYVYAYFARLVPVDDAVPLTRRILSDWGDGLRDPPVSGEISLDEFHRQIKEGTYYGGQFGVQGQTGGSVTFTVFGKRSEGGRRLCTLMFRPA